MSGPEDSELTPEERAALESLPRERSPDPGLRDRTLAELRRRGAFAEPAAARVAPPGVREAAAAGPGDSAGRGSSHAARPLRWLIGTAAAALIFAAGMGVGGAIGGGADPTGPAAAAAPGPLPLTVQRYGTGYVEAIARLAGEDGSADPQGRDAALSAFRGAAGHLARLAGHDAATRQVLLAARDLEPAGDPEEVERWF